MQDEGKVKPSQKKALTPKAPAPVPRKPVSKPAPIQEPKNTPVEESEISSEEGEEDGYSSSGSSGYSSSSSSTVSSSSSSSSSSGDSLYRNELLPQTPK